VQNSLKVDCRSCSDDARTSLLSGNSSWPRFPSLRAYRWTVVVPALPSVLWDLPLYWWAGRLSPAGRRSPWDTASSPSQPERTPFLFKAGSCASVSVFLPSCSSQTSLFTPPPQFNPHLPFSLLASSPLNSLPHTRVFVSLEWSDCIETSGGTFCCSAAYLNAFFQAPKEVGYRPRPPPARVLRVVCPQATWGPSWWERVSL
jgi:hypothetical protein